MFAPKWSFCLLATLAVVASAAHADAQQPKGRTPAIITYPQINSWPGLPASQFNQPAYNPGPFYNPALNNPYLNQTQIVPVNAPINPVFAPNNPFPLVPPNPFANNPFANNPFGNNPFPSYSTPPVARQLPGQLFYRGPDLQVNPTAGLVYKPLSGIARTSDGSVFYHVPNTGLPTVTGAYAPGSGLYYDPAHNTFLNPATGVISRPGVTTVFVPWIR